jgi:membrane fusion protein (multidrug efflux system)
MMQENTNSDNKISQVKGKKRGFLILFAIAFLITGLYIYNHSTTYVSTDDAYIDGHNIRISSKISGNISKVYITDNQKVKKGTLLAEIENSDYRVRYDQVESKLQAAIEKQKSADVNVGLTSVTSSANKDQANSAVGAAEASIKVAYKQISQAQSSLEQINNDIESTKAELELAQTDYSRYQKLYKKGVVSKQDYDRVSTTLKTINAKYKSSLEKSSAATSQLQAAYSNKDISLKMLDQANGKFKGANTVDKQVSMSESARKIANAEIKQLQAAVKQAKLELSYTKIYAPSDGVVTNRTVEEGAYAQIGQPLLSIVSDDRWIIANFKETQLTNIKIGQPVNIKIDTYPNRKFKGKIDSVQASTGSKSSLFPPENAVGSFVKVVQRIPVKIIFTEKIAPEYAIVPGMSAIPEVKVK